jgi:hypothetical protein
LLEIKWLNHSNAVSLQTWKVNLHSGKVPLHGAAQLSAPYHPSKHPLPAASQKTNRRLYSSHLASAAPVAEGVAVVEALPPSPVSLAKTVGMQAHSKESCGMEPVLQAFQSD